MKHIIKNKHWNIPEDYNIDKILYLLIDRPNEINNCNDFFWLNNEKLVHREYDLPAIVCTNGHVFWYKNSKLHIENNKPAIILHNGEKQHWKNGSFTNETYY